MVFGFLFPVAQSAAAKEQKEQEKREKAQRKEQERREKARRKEQESLEKAANNQRNKQASTCNISSVPWMRRIRQHRPSYVLKCLAIFLPIALPENMPGWPVMCVHFDAFRRSRSRDWSRKHRHPNSPSEVPRLTSSLAASTRHTFHVSALVFGPIAFSWSGRYPRADQRPPSSPLFVPGRAAADPSPFNTATPPAPSRAGRAMHE